MSLKKKSGKKKETNENDFRYNITEEAKGGTKQKKESAKG